MTNKTPDEEREELLAQVAQLREALEDAETVLETVQHQLASGPGHKATWEQIAELLCEELTAGLARIRSS